MKQQIHFFLSILTFLIFLPSNSFAGWSVNGSAFVSGDRVTLTRAINNQTGSAWIDTKIDLSNDFDISFQINLGNSDGGADGISFALHNDPDGTAAFGDTTGGGKWVGMNGICPAIGIEVDTYYNDDEGDLGADHLGINVYSSNCTGVPNHNAAGPVPAGDVANIEDGNDHDFRITWDVSAQEIQVFFDGAHRLTYHGNIINILGASDAYIGYTASTGGAVNEQSIVANNANVDADKTVTPDIFLKSANPKIATYTIDIMNNGSVTAFGTKITDTLPEGVTYVKGSSTGATTSDPDIGTGSDPNRDVLSWNLSATPISPGGTRSISFEAIIPDTTGTFENDFTVSGDNFNQISKTVTAAVLVGPSDLAVSTAHSGDFLKGSTGEYTVDITNNGPDVAEGITLTATLPAGITYVSHAEPDWIVAASSPTEITFAHANSVNSNSNTSTLTITVNVGATSPSISNSVSVASSSPDPDISNNTDKDTIIVKSSGIDLAVQMNHTNTFAEGVAGDYEIIVSNVGTVDETGTVVVTDSLPSGLTYVSSSGTSWTATIVSASEITWAHPGPVSAGTSLPALIVTVSPNSTAIPSVTNTVSVVSSGTDTDNVNNTSDDFTTVLGADAANKPLYLMPGQTLSRTMPTPSTSIEIQGSNQSKTWTLSPALAGDINLAAGAYPIRLILERKDTKRTKRKIKVSLKSTDATTGNIGLPITQGGISIDPGTAGITEIVVNIDVPSMTLPAGSSIEMTVENSSKDAIQSIFVYPEWNGTYSSIGLNSETVIHIGDLLDAYDNAYDIAVPGGGGAIPSSFLSGETVYLRAPISDPFGSYDITRASIDIINPSGITMLSGETMTEVYDTGGAEKTYEYAFDTTSYPNGVWTARVTAFEGSENIVTDVKTVPFVITTPMPDLTVVKSVLTTSDPVNNTTNPKAIPGAVVTYVVMVTNTGPGVVDNDSFVITDSLPPNTELYFDPSAGPISFSDGGSSLSYLYSGPGSLTDDIEFFNGGGAYIPMPDASGFDDTITSFIINLKGTFNSYSGVGTPPSCSAIFRVRIK